MVAGLAATAAVAAGQPRWTANGAVKALGIHTITVGHQTCRITAASPPRSVLRLYYVGASAKIACVRGVLRAIDVLAPQPVINASGPAHCGGSTLNFVANSSVSLSHSDDCSFTSDVLAGHFTITALSSSSLTAGTSLVGLTCGIDGGSPDTSALVVGTQLTRLTCRNGTLTGFIGT